MVTMEDSLRKKLLVFQVKRVRRQSVGEQIKRTSELVLNLYRVNL